MNYILFHIRIIWDSSLVYRMNNQEIRIQFSTGNKHFFVLQCPCRPWNPPSPLSIDCWELCPQGSSECSHPPSVKKCVQIYFHSPINGFAMTP